MPSWELENTVLKEVKSKDNSNLTNNYVCGIDEVGRGSLAGPVVACAAVFKTRNVDFLAQVNDSKQLSKQKREKLAQQLHNNTFYAIGFSSHLEIDSLNIHNASLLAMERAYYNLCKSCFPCAVLIDGNKNINFLVKSYAIVKGDSKSFSIAAASIIAKVYRDNLMVELSKEENNSCYNWQQNAGYATKQHKEAIQSFGISKYHRKSFAPIKFYC